MYPVRLPKKEEFAFFPHPRAHIICRNIFKSTVSKTSFVQQTNCYLLGDMITTSFNDEEIVRTLETMLARDANVHC